MSQDEDLEALLYEAVHCGNEGDVEFYQGVCAGADSVLELGCGSGRVALALSNNVGQIVGLDIDSASVRLATRRGLTCFVGDMCKFATAIRYDRIIIPYNGLYCLAEPDELVACLRTVHDHLSPHGELIFDGYVAHPGPAELATAPLSTAPDWVATVHVQGERWDVYEQSVLLPENQRLQASYRCVGQRKGKEIETVIPQRYLLATELDGLLGAANLTLSTLTGGFNNEAFDDTSERMVVRAKRQCDV